MSFSLLGAAHIKKPTRNQFAMSNKTLFPQFSWCSNYSIISKSHNQPQKTPTKALLFSLSSTLDSNRFLAARQTLFLSSFVCARPLPGFPPTHCYFLHPTQGHTHTSHGLTNHRHAHSCNRLRLRFSRAKGTRQTKWLSNCKVQKPGTDHKTIKV